MKKIFTILFTAVGFTSMAQSHSAYDSHQQYSHNQISQRHDDSYSFDMSSKNKEIAMINREYDSKIYAVRHDRFLSPRARDRKITNLQIERSAKIRKVEVRFSDKRNHWNTGSYRR